ncbi:MAG: hypothetical protein AB1Z19_07260 [Eubacteriales bacterium]
MRKLEIKPKMGKPVPFRRTPRTLQRVQGVFSCMKQKNQKAERVSAQEYATDKSL